MGLNDHQVSELNELFKQELIDARGASKMDDDLQTIETAVKKAFKYIEFKFDMLNPDGSNIWSHFYGLDRTIGGFPLSELIIFAGNQGVVISALALNVAHNVADKSQLPVLIYSARGKLSGMEIGLWLMSSVSKVPLRCLSNGIMFDQDWFDLVNAARQTYNLPIFIKWSEGIYEKDMVLKMKHFISEQNIGLVIIDASYQQLYPDKVKENDSGFLQALKTTTKKLKIPVIVTCTLKQSENESMDSSDSYYLQQLACLEQYTDFSCYLNMKADCPNQSKGFHEKLVEFEIRKHPRGGPRKFYLAFSEGTVTIKDINYS